MTGAKRWRFGSTARTRSLVLLALGVVKVATAAQLRQLVLPGTADGQIVRNECKGYVCCSSIPLGEWTCQSLRTGARPVRRLRGQNSPR